MGVGAGKRNPEGLHSYPRDKASHVDDVGLCVHSGPAGPDSGAPRAACEPRRHPVVSRMHRALLCVALLPGACLSPSHSPPTRKPDPDRMLGGREREVARGERGTPTPTEPAPRSGQDVVDPTTPTPKDDGGRFAVSDVEFSGLVAGVPLWVDIATTALGCNGPASKFFVLNTEPKPIPAAEARAGDMMLCANPPVDPFRTHNVTDSVLLTLCDSPIGLLGCSASVILKKNDYAAAATLLEQVSEKYGAGTRGEIPFSCASPTEQERQFKRIWYVPVRLADEETYAYRIVVGWTCEPSSGPRKPGILFVYQTPSEIQRRHQETRDRQDSF